MEIISFVTSFISTIFIYKILNLIIPEFSNQYYTLNLSIDSSYDRSFYICKKLTFLKSLNTPDHLKFTINEIKYIIKNDITIKKTEMILQVFS